MCPVMGKITVRGDKNTFVQFASKIKVNPDLWNATSQRCTGKSRESVNTNREIESLLLLIRCRFNELIDYNNLVTAQDVKNAFQGITAAQTTLLKVFQEHNDEYALRVGVNRAATTYYQYRNTYRLLSLFMLCKVTKTFCLYFRLLRTRKQSRAPRAMHRGRHRRQRTPSRPNTPSSRL